MNKYQPKIEELEEKGLFDKEVVPINPKFVKPIDKKFTYLPKNPIYKSYSMLIRGFLNLAGPIFTKLAYGIKVEGRENIKGIKNAIVTSNHVMFTDNLISRVAIKKSKVYFAGADFNNKKGFAGLTLRAGGFLPLGTTYSQKTKFNDAVAKLLKNNSYIVFFPEGSLWPKYEKPRPFKRGAFYYAVKNSVPVIPIYICFEKLKNKREKFRIRVKILKPIYANNSLNERDCIEDMKIKTQNEYKLSYEQFYKKPLEFKTK